MTNPPLRLALIGWGAIAQTAAALLDSEQVEVVAVATRSRTGARPDVPASARRIVDPTELAATQPDVVAEAASSAGVGPWGRAALTAGADFIISSVAALADEQLLDLLRDLAGRRGAQVHIQPGALAGVDGLAAARSMGIDAVEHRIVKPPLAWMGTAAEDMCRLHPLSEPVAFFHADAAETASRFPKNANVAMTTALAGIGPRATKITLVADPDATTNRHEIAAHGAFGELNVAISNNPLPANPKTSSLAALSLIRAIENRTQAIVI
ncbi:MAG: aspartate dehydrogenase [Acidimicrobiaceae bacterium]|nr:aspartate dehydrogenase [Acidimicrobiaceae bacterium]